MSRKIIGATVTTPMSVTKVENDMKPVKTVNGVRPDENGNVAIATSGGGSLWLLYVTHNGVDNFSCDRTYGEAREAIVEEMPVLGIITNTATGVTEQLHAELHDEDGEIHFVSTHGGYILYGDESWEYDPMLASGGSTNFGKEHAGKLVYIDAAGKLIPLVLGEGLAIINGVLTLGGVVENVEALLSADGYVLRDSNGLYIKAKEVA